MVALVVAALYSFTAMAASPSATPRIITDTNASVSQNVTSALATNQLLGYANFTSQNGSQEENSTFKWLKKYEVMAL